MQPRSSMMRLATRALSVALAATLLLVPGLASAGHGAGASLDGELQVVNDRAQAIHLSIDGEPAGAIGPRGTRTLGGVPNGVRRVTVTSPGLPAVSESVSVPPRGRASLRVAPMTGRARIDNQSGVPMRVRLDGHDLGLVRPGARLETDQLLAGEHTLVAFPAGPHARDAAPERETFTVRPGGATQVRLAPWLAELLVTNPFPHRANVWIDGRLVASVAPGQSLLIAQQTPGRHDVSLRASGRVLAADAVRLTPGGKGRFAPVYLPTGDLRVTNATARPMEVELDGRTLGRLRPGQTALYRDLPAGDFLLTADGRGRRDLHQRVRIAPDRTAAAVFNPPAPRAVVVAPRPAPPVKAKPRGKGKPQVVVSATF